MGKDLKIAKWWVLNAHCPTTSLRGNELHGNDTASGPYRVSCLVHPKKSGEDQATTKDNYQWREPMIMW